MLSTEPLASLLSTPSMLQVGMTVTPEFRSGTDRYFISLLNALARSDGDVRATALGNTARIARPIVNLESFAPVGANRIRRWSGLRHAVSRLARDVDLVVAHGVAHIFPALDCIGDRPLVLHYHGPWTREARAEGRNAATILVRSMQERAVVARAARFIVLSNAYADLLKSDFNVPAERIDVIPGGIDLADFESEYDRAEARQLLGLTATGPLVACASRLNRSKGVFELVEAFAAVRAAVPEAQLVLAGTGPDRAALEHEIARRGLRDAVRLLGHLGDEMPLLYRAADITVVPTPLLEGFGLVAIESLALGTPVLVTPVGGLREAVAGLEPAVIFDGTKPADLARGMLAVLCHRRALPDTDACLAHARRFAWPNIVERVAEVYRNAVRSPLR
ncbi:MAG: glycosyltransferase family 4 protein [Vulcanimicrobiaceae bacterium]